MMASIKKTIREIMFQVKLGAKVLGLVWQSSPKWTAFYLGTTVLQNLAPTAGLYVSKLIIDAVVIATKNPTDESIKILIFYSLLQLIIYLLNSAFSNLSMHGYDVLKDIYQRFATNQVLTQAADLDISFFDDHNFHDKYEKVQREIYYRPQQTMDQIVWVISSIATIFSLFFLLWQLSPWAPLIIFVASLPRLIFRLKYAYWTYDINDERSPDNRRVNQIISLFTSDYNAKEMKIFRLKDHLLRLFNQINDRFIQKNRALSVKQNWYSFFLDLSGEIVYILLFLYAIYRTIWGQSTLGDLTMFTSAIRQFQVTLHGFIAYISRFYESNLFLKHFFDFMALKPRVVNSAKPQKITGNEPLRIEFKKVSFGYEPNKPVLKNVSFVLENAQNLALVGENGAGKTTLIKLLLRLYDVTEGQILINDVDIREIEIADLHRNLGVIFQDFLRYDFTVRENIGFGEIERINDLKAIKEAAKLANAEEFIEKLSQKYETILGKNFENGAELSGGEWQKIALARAFFSRARALILDEPTASLDPKSEFEVFQNLIKHTKNKSLILISHRFSTVRLADKILVLHHGQIEETGTHEELMTHDGRYAKLYKLQAKWYQR